MRGDATPADIAFGRCIVMVAQRRLLVDGVAAVLGDRAFELLLALIAGHGGCVSKDALMARVWPGRIVEENTLEGRMSLLRRALGPERAAIRTIAGRGYQFVADLHAVDLPPAAVTPPPPSEMPGHPLPARVSTLIGRAVAQGEIVELAHSHRLVTLVGTGGIGKTRLAIEAARALAPAFSDGAFLAELGPVRSADFVATAVASALGLPQEGGATLEQMAILLRSRHLLLVLDNCEHLVGAAALLAERLLQAAPRLCIIATSREALRIEGEYVYRVASLDLPEIDLDPDADAGTQPLAGSGALQLFQARLGPDVGDLATPRSLAMQARICHRLDGIPLALELAAARVAVLGLEGVAARLDDRFHLLNNGARTALPRQQTLRATLDWSHDLLAPGERAVFAQLSIFPGHFSFDAAVAIATMPGQSPGEVEHCIASLVEKSLVSVDRAGASLRYRLLETTRAYARERLPGAAAADLARAHALFFLAVFEAAEPASHDRIAPAWRAHQAPHLEDLRAAVTWACSAGGDAALGVRLTLAGMPLLLQLGLLEETLARVDLALAWLEQHAGADAGSRMKLYAARGTALLYQRASAATGAAFREVLALADQQGDTGYQKLGVWGLWCHAYLNGHYAHALVLARRFHQLAAGGQGLARSQVDLGVADRIVGITHLCLGNLEASRAALERMLDGAGPPCATRRSIRFLYDEQMLARTSLAHTLYLQGFPEQAERQAALALAGARALGHLPSVCYALSEGVCSIALLVGDHATLAQAAAALDDATARTSSTWKARSRLWIALPQLLAGRSGVYDDVMAPALAEIGVARFFISLTPLLTTVALALGEQGRIGDGMAIVEPALKQARASGDACSLVELTRAQAVLVSMRGCDGDAARAGQQLAGALASARARGFRSWELRAALALAQVAAPA